MAVKLLPAMETIIGQALESTGRPLIEAGLTPAWDVVDREAAAMARHYGYDLITLINDSTRQQIGQVIGRWIEGGYGDNVGLPTLVEEIYKLVPANPYPFIRDRARLIAQTETTRVYADARMANFKAVGLMQMVWNTAHDELVCPICRPLHDQVGTVERGVVSPDSGQLYKPPAHPGCRCWLSESPAELEALAGMRS